MEYDPFRRGPFPVGVRSGLAIDKTRDNRRLPFEIWYPAAASYGGIDLVSWTQDSFTVVDGAPPLRQAAARDAQVQPGSYPLVVFSHTSGGHRRQSSFLCTHLASHGYVVAAADHMGSTAMDFADRARRLAEGVTPTSEEIQAITQKLIGDRVPDLRFLIHEVLTGAPGDVSRQVDAQRVGLIGWSFGGWAVLATPEVDGRIGAVVAMAPAGNSKPLPGILPVKLTFAWKRDVPTLFLVADRDRLTPLPGQYELLERAPSATRMFILSQAGHFHFGDEIDESELCAKQQAQFFTRGLALGHMDATLKQSAPAEQFLANDPAAKLRGLGIGVVEYTGPREWP